MQNDWEYLIFNHSKYTDCAYLTLTRISYLTLTRIRALFNDAAVQC